MAKKYPVFKVAESWMSIWIRTGPGVSYKTKGVIYGKDKKKYTVLERKNKYWLKLKEVDGWCCELDSNGSRVMKSTGKYVTEDGKDTTNSSKPENKETNKTTTVNEESYAYVPTHDIVSSSLSDYMGDIENNLTIANLRGIFGMPYQFMSSVDTRLTTKPGSIGRKYADEIISNMPLLLMTPGKPVFMAKYTDKDKKKILEKFIDVAVGGIDEIGAAVFTEDFGKYYSLEYAYNDYFKFVNPMCRVAARMLNLQDEKIDGTKLESYNWAKNANKNFNKLFSVYRGCTAWYCDSEKDISDSFSNGTSESMIASKVNSLSDYGRELNFLLGTVKTETGVLFDKFTSQENLATNMANVNDFIDSALGNNNGVSNIFSSITNGAQTILAGGKLVFPEIWSDSSFSRSYNINLKLVSPSGDNLSIYLNIIAPMLHLLGFVLPREGGKSRSLISPFLVRAFYKGLFNVDMGIITDMTFTKGKEAGWNAEGLPLTVDVSFTIKDLYNDMYMTNQDSFKHNMTKNIILMDYISNLCGININEVDVYRSIDLFFIQNVKNRITDTWHMKIFGSLDQWVTNKWRNMFSKF